MNIYVITRYSLELKQQLSPLAAATTMKYALYLLHKEINKRFEEEAVSMAMIEETLDNFKTLIDCSVEYGIFKTELEQ